MLIQTWTPHTVIICPLITEKEFKSQEKGRYYNLLDSVIVGDVFKGSRGQWFLWIETDKPSQLRSVSLIDEGLCNEVATSSEISSVKSVSEMIKKHFSDEVASSPVFPHVTARKQDDCSLQVSKKLWVNSGGQNKPEVGERLLVAFNNLGVSRGCKPYMLSLLKSNNSYKSKATARKLVYEIED